MCLLHRQWLVALLFPSWMSDEREVSDDRLVWLESPLESLQGTVQMLLCRCHRASQRQTSQSAARWACSVPPSTRQSLLWCQTTLHRPLMQKPGDAN